MDTTEVWLVGLSVLLALTAFAMFAWRRVFGPPIGGWSFVGADNGSLIVRKGASTVATFVPPAPATVNNKTCVDPALCSNPQTVTLDQCVRSVQATSNAPYVQYRVGKAGCSECTPLYAPPPELSSAVGIELKPLNGSDAATVCGDKSKVATLTQLNKMAIATRTTGGPVDIGAKGVMAMLTPSGAQQQLGTPTMAGCLTGKDATCSTDSAEADVAMVTGLPGLVMGRNGVFKSLVDMEITGGLVGNWVADRQHTLNGDASMNACQLATVDSATITELQMDATYPADVLAKVTPQC